MKFPASLFVNQLPDSLMRRCFARSLLRVNLVGKESLHCLALSTPHPLDVIDHKADLSAKGRARKADAYREHLHRDGNRRRLR